MQIRAPHLRVPNSLRKRPAVARACRAGAGQSTDVSVDSASSHQLQPVPINPTNSHEFLPSFPINSHQFPTILPIKKGPT